jgi:putative oxidoreductase
MAYGILLLRVVLGLTMAGHGAQKLFGAFGGPGLEGAGGFFGQLRFRAPKLLALVASATELGCGLLLALGLLTPLAALGIAVVMVTAVGSVHMKNGFWNGGGGWEFNLLIWTSAVTIAATGPLRFSLDRALGWDDNLSGLWWGVGVAAGSLAIAALHLTAGRRAEEPVRVPLAEAAEERRQGERRDAAA